jgi:hypothetical protein
MHKIAVQINIKLDAIALEQGIDYLQKGTTLHYNVSISKCLS